MNEDTFVGLKSRLAVIESQLEAFKTRRNALMKQMQEEFGVNSVEELDALCNKLAEKTAADSKELETLYASCEKSISEIEAKLATLKNGY